MTVRLLLVRHGESEWNRASRYAGQRDVPLSELGQAQAVRLAERLHDEPLDAICTSPLRRAHDTAAAIASRKRMPVMIEPRLMEINHGLWEGLGAQEVERRFPGQYALWRMEPQRAIMPEGESLAALARRAAEALSDLLSAFPRGKIAICSHDAVLRVLLLQALGLPLEHFWKWEFANASLSIVDACGANAPSAVRLAQLNETAHLAGMRSEMALQAL